MSQRLRQLISLIFILLTLAFSGAIIHYKEALLSFSQYGYLGTFIISFFGSATVLFPVPSLLATFAVGSVYEPFIIGPIAATGAALGELTGYAAGLGGRVLLTKEQKFLKSLKIYFFQAKVILKIRLNA